MARFRSARDGSRNADSRNDEVRAAAQTITSKSAKAPAKKLPVKHREKTTEGLVTPSKNGKSPKPGLVRSVAEGGKPASTSKHATTQPLLTVKRGFLNDDDGFQAPGLKRISLESFIDLVNRRTLTKLDNELIRILRTASTNERSRINLETVRSFGERLWEQEEDAELEGFPLNCHAFPYWRFRQLWKQSGFDEPYIAEPQKEPKRGRLVKQNPRDNTIIPDQPEFSFKGKAAAAAASSSAAAAAAAAADQTSLDVTLQKVWQEAFDSTLQGLPSPDKSAYPGLSPAQIQSIQSRAERKAHHYAVTNGLSIPAKPVSNGILEGIPDGSTTIPRHPPQPRGGGSRVDNPEHLRSASASEEEEEEEDTASYSRPSTLGKRPRPAFAEPPVSATHEVPAPDARPSHPGHGPVSSPFNQPTIADPDTGLRRENPFWQTLPGPERWHRCRGAFFPFGETARVQAEMGRRIAADLAGGAGASPSQRASGSSPLGGEEEKEEVLEGFLGKVVGGVQVDSSAGRADEKSERARGRAQKTWGEKRKYPPPFALPEVMDEEVRRAMEEMEKEGRVKKRRSKAGREEKVLMSGGLGIR